MRKSCRTLLSLCLLIGLLTSGHTQTDVLSFYQLGQPQGLSNQLNAHFCTDAEGYLWTSSRNGLNRFDGHSVKTFLPELNGQLIDPNINSAVFLDSLGRRWFTSSTALHYLTPEQDSMVSFQFDGQEQSYYYAFHLERDSFLWVVANSHLYVVPIFGDISSTIPRFPFPVYQVHALENEQGKVSGLIRPLYALGTGLEVRWMNATEMTIDTFFDGSDPDKWPRASFGDMLVLSESSVWLPSSAGLIHFNPQEPIDFSVFRHRTDQKEFSYESAVLEGQKYLWIGSLDEGLLRFDMEDVVWSPPIQKINMEGDVNSIPGILRMHLDQHKTLWLSDFANGLYYTSLPNAKFDQAIPMHTLEESNEFSVTTIAKKDSLIWIGNPDRGVFPIRSSQSNKLGISTDLSHFSIAPGNSIWVLNQQNLVTYKEGDVVCRSLIPALNICWPTDSTSVINTFQSLLWYPSTYPDPDRGLKIAKVNLPAELYFDKAANLLFLSQGDNTLRVFDPALDLQEKEPIKNVGTVNGFCLSARQNGIWLASSTGVYRYDPDQHQVVAIHIPAKLNSSSFTDVVEDQNGDLWLSSYQGLYRYQTTSRNWTHYTEEDGLLSLEFMPNASLLDTDGTIYFGSRKGVVYFHPDSIRDNTTPPNMELARIWVNDTKRPVSWFTNTSNRSLSAFDNDLSFQFNVIDFTNPNENRFRYALTNQRGDTLQTGDDRRIDLYGLQPGSYNLIARAHNADGEQYAISQSYPFTIRPPWYRTWWARTLGVLLFLALVYGIYRVRVRQIARREAFKRKEAEYKQLVAETETAVLRLQMNPHFLFNSMNSINAYILQRDVDKASEYLNHFARLMRRILELSEHPLITVDEEMELLEQYLTAEAMRMSRPMTYSFDVDPDLEPDEVLLPTMLLQPFVENAIWHGLSPKDGGGHIAIGFRQKGQQLECSVEDNGVGRSRTESKHKTHRSKALEITRKRLNVLAEQEKAKTDLQILDLTHPDGSPAGTRVVVLLPVL
jgi:ligand-binding sensor domain-containing protein/signal transduction histidine kinase